LTNSEAKLHLNPTTDEEFPHRPHHKNSPTFDVQNTLSLAWCCRKWAIFLQWGSMGKLFICCQIQFKFLPRVCL